MIKRSEIIRSILRHLPAKSPLIRERSFLVELLKETEGTPTVSVEPVSTDGINVAYSENFKINFNKRIKQLRVCREHVRWLRGTTKIVGQMADMLVSSPLFINTFEKLERRLVDPLPSPADIPKMEGAKLGISQAVLSKVKEQTALAMEEGPAPVVSFSETFDNLNDAAYHLQIAVYVQEGKYPQAAKLMNHLAIESRERLPLDVWSFLAHVKS